MWPVWARLIVAPPARGHLEVTLSVFLDSGGSWSFFVQEIYIKSNVRLSKNTYVFEPSFSDIYFTGWVDFSFIFSVFSGLTAFISGIWYFFCFFIFLLNTPWSSEYTWVDFILMQASDWPWKEVGARASQRESQPFVGNKPIESLHKYEINVYSLDHGVFNRKIKKAEKVPNTRDKRG